jgi:hypothetical protein
MTQTSADRELRAEVEHFLFEEFSRRRRKTRGGGRYVITGFVPTISIRKTKLAD